jgi:hypothetical protein
MLLPLSLFYKPSHPDSVWPLVRHCRRVESIPIRGNSIQYLKTFAENEHGNLPPVAMHELIMPEASGRMMQNRNISSVSITRSAAFFPLPRLRTANDCPPLSVICNGLRRVERRLPQKSPDDDLPSFTARLIDLALAGCLRGMIESGNVPTNPRRYSTSWVAIASARLPKLLR